MIKNACTTPFIIFSPLQRSVMILWVFVFCFVNPKSQLLFSCVSSESCFVKDRRTHIITKATESTIFNHNITREGFYFTFDIENTMMLCLCHNNAAFPTWQRRRCWTAVIHQDDARQQHRQRLLERKCGVLLSLSGKKKANCFLSFATFWCKKSVMAISTSHGVGSHPASCEGEKTDWKEILSQRCVCSHLPARDRLPSHRFLSIIGFYLRPMGSGWTLQCSGG